MMSQVLAQSTDLAELASIARRLAPERRRQLTDFAAFLLHRDGCEAEGPDEDEAWERTFSDPAGHPKLHAFVKESLSKPSEPLDLDKL